MGHRDSPEAPKLAKVMARTPQSLEKGVPLETILEAFGTNRCRTHAVKKVLKKGCYTAIPFRSPVFNTFVEGMFFTTIGTQKLNKQKMLTVLLVILTEDH